MRACLSVRAQPAAGRHQRPDFGASCIPDLAGKSRKSPGTAGASWKKSAVVSRQSRRFWGTFVAAAVILRLFIQKHQTNPAAPHQMGELINIAPPDNNLVIMTAETRFRRRIMFGFASRWRWGDELMPARLLSSIFRIIDPSQICWF